MSRLPAGRRGKRKGSGHHEEHENHERWLVTYADMVTLLMVLFIVLLGMSSVDAKKFEQLANGLASSFGAHDVAFTGRAAPLQGEVGNPVLPLAAGVAPALRESVGKATKIDADAEADAEAVAQAVRAAERQRVAKNAQAARDEVDNLWKIRRRIEASLRRAKQEQNVRFTIDERGLVVTVVTSKVVFAGDRADLLADGRKIIDAVAPALRDLPNKIEVDGHTNQLPVPTVNYPSAWELSTARASTVVRYLARRGIRSNRLSAAGFADTQPLISPKDPRSVTMNRRVDIVVLSTLGAEQRALLPEAADG